MYAQHEFQHGILQPGEKKSYFHAILSNVWRHSCMYQNQKKLTLTYVVLVKPKKVEGLKAIDVGSRNVTLQWEKHTMPNFDMMYYLSWTNNFGDKVSIKICYK